MIVFQNKGLIDPKAITTLGISVKEEGSIGYFGSGLKYAIAIILRLQGSIKIYIEHDLYEFYTKSIDVKGKAFDIICMKTKEGEQELGFTTRTGVNWEAWQAFRELYCNAIDEGGTVFQCNSVEKDYQADFDMTTIVVDHPEFDKLYHMRNIIVLPENEYTTVTEYGTIYDQETKYVYYRRIRALDLGGQKALFRYNLKQEMKLTEDRTFASLYTMEHYICRMLVSCNDNNIIRKMFLADQTYIEYNFNIASFMSIASQEFRDVVLEFMHSNVVVLHPQFDIICAKLFPDKWDQLEYVPTEIQRKMYDKALSVLLAANIDILEYKVIFKESLTAGALGQAKNNNIYISKACFELGTKMLAGTLYEEYVHLKTGHSDESRGMQNYLINQIMSLIEEHVTKEPV